MIEARIFIGAIFILRGFLAEVDNQSILKIKIMKFRFFYRKIKKILFLKILIFRDFSRDFEKNLKKIEKIFILCATK